MTLLATLAPASTHAVPKPGGDYDTQILVVTLYGRGSRIEHAWGEPGILVATATANKQCVVMLRELPQNDGLSLRGAAMTLCNLVNQRIEIRHPMLGTYDAYWFDATKAGQPTQWVLNHFPTDAGIRCDLVPASAATTPLKRRPPCNSNLFDAAMKELARGMDRVKRLS